MSKITSDLGMKAKKTLEEFVPVIDSKIVIEIEKEIGKKFGFNQRQKQVVKEALEHGKEYILRPTKRLRGSFVIYGFKLGGGRPDEKIWRAAVGIELVHAALLMHDDFMDGDEQRRRGVTTHRYFEQKFGGDAHLGEAMAVTVGDALLCIGFELIQDTGNAAAMKQVLRGITNTAWGQGYDVTLEAFTHWTQEDVLVLHRAKTAVYTYENPLFAGTFLAVLPDGVRNILKDYSRDGGIAFQLQDDILGVYGDPAKTGKSADSDLKQGKCTLLVLKVFEEGTEQQKTAVRRVWGKRDAGREELDAAKVAIKDSGSYEYSKNLAMGYAAKAAKTAEKLRELKLNPEAIDYIQGIAEYMTEREV